MTNSNYNTSINQRLIERVFVNHSRRPDLENRDCFEFNGNNYACYTEFLDDQITLVLDPIRDYASQLDEMAAGNEIPQGIASILFALINNALKTLQTWQIDAEKHIGRIGIRRVTHRNKGNDLKADDSVAVELLEYKRTRA